MTKVVREEALKNSKYHKNMRTTKIRKSAGNFVIRTLVVRLIFIYENRPHRVAIRRILRDGNVVFQTASGLRRRHEVMFTPQFGEPGVQEVDFARRLRYLSYGNAAWLPNRSRELDTLISCTCIILLGGERGAEMKCGIRRKRW